ncbi:MAG: nucleotidyltransferase domain-containing protein [Gemmatimonadales bacterium]|nr:nucleotidyltransferase domain-containing protein [Gemmatimonadales bacterium]
MRADSAAAHARTLVARATREVEARAAAAAAIRQGVGAALRALAPGLRISRAVLFGSLAWGEFDPARSDVDLLVWGLPAGAAIDAACAIGDRVGRPVHVVRAETAAASLRERAELEGVALDVS